MVVLVTCINQDPIKNDGAKVFTTLYIDLADAQGQITPQSVAGFRIIIYINNKGRRSL